MADEQFECPECGDRHLASFHRQPNEAQWQRMCQAHRENAERWEARARAAEAFVPVASTPEMRNRLRELASPPRDDFDRAVLIVLDDFDRLANARETGANIKYQLRVCGVGRIADEPRAVLVAFDDRPTDDEIRSIHECLRTWGPTDV